MNDLLWRAEKLRNDAAEYAMTAGEVSDKKRRDLFVTLARQLTLIADQLEKRARLPSEAFLGRKNYDPFSRESEPLP